MLSHHAISQKPDENLINRFKSLYHLAFSNMENGTKKPSQFSTKDSDVRGNGGHSVDMFSFDNCPPLFPANPSCEGKSLGVQIPDFDLSRSESETGEISGDFVEQKAPENFWSSPSQSSTRSFSECLQDAAPSQLWNSIDPFGANSCLPTQFTHDITDYGSMNLANPAMPDRGTNVSPRREVEQVVNHSSLSGEGSTHAEFCFETVLRAPTARVNYRNETPVSYLNKGQIYQITVKDSLTSAAPYEAMNFRTSIRISFEKEHRRNSASRWQLWKDGRASSRSSKGNLPPMAVQYAGQTDQMRVEEANLDGFSIFWSTSATGTNQCSIPVRFNFLSTDFSLSKGTRGTSVRLCVKTERIGDPFSHEPEISFCHVKLFRDHGAERKMSNDAAIVRRRMEKLKLEAKSPQLGKPSKTRRRNRIDSESFAYPDVPQKHLGDTFLHSKPNNILQAELRSLQKKLDGLQWTLESSKPETKFSLRADSVDDPDLHPQISMDVSKLQPQDPLHRSIPSVRDGDSRKSRKLDYSDSATSPKNDVSLQRVSNPDPSTLAVACFYIQIRNNSLLPNKLYRAIYPKERTALELKRIIFESDSTFSPDTSSMFYINRAGLQVLVDDKFIQNIAEGQDMVVETRKSVDHTDSIQCPTRSKDIYLVY